MSATSLAISIIAAKAPTVEVLAAFIDAGGSIVARKQRRITVTAFTVGFVDLTGWGQARLSTRLAADVSVRALGAWLALATAVPVDADYVRAHRHDATARLHREGDEQAVGNAGEAGRDQRPTP